MVNKAGLRGEFLGSLLDFFFLIRWAQHSRLSLGDIDLCHGTAALLKFDQSHE